MKSTLAAYREDIIAEAQDPQNYGLLTEPDHTATFGNRSCGDTVTVSLNFKQTDMEWVVTKIGWEGEGCVISQACASVLSQAIIGKSMLEIGQITVADVLKLLGLTHISLGREKCAEVGLLAIQDAVKQHTLATKLLIDSRS